MPSGLGQSGLARPFPRDMRLRRFVNSLQRALDQHLGDGLFIDSEGKLATSAMPQVKLRQTTNQALPNATETAVAFSDGAEYDNSGGWFSAGANTKITVDSTAVYQIVYSGKITTSGASTLTLAVKQNGTTIVARSIQPSTTAGTAEISGVMDVQLTAGDFLELFITQDSGGPQAIDEAVLAVKKVGVI